MVAVALVFGLVFGLGLASCAIEERSGPEPPLRLVPDASSIQVGETVLFAARGARGPVTWTTSDPRVAVVAGNTGQAKAVGAGAVRVIAVSGGQRGEAALTVIRRPEVVLSTGSASFSAVAGGDDPAPQAVAITNGGDAVLSGLSLSVGYPEGGPTGWLSATLSRTVAPATLLVQPNTTGLAPGTHTATVRVAALDGAGHSSTLDVTLELGDAPSLELSRDTVGFEAVVGGAVPAPIAVGAVNGGGGGEAAVRGLTATVPAGAQGWLRARLSSTATPAILTLLVEPAGLAAGSYAAEVTVAGSTGGERRLAVALDVTSSATAAIGLSAASAEFVAEPGGSGNARPTPEARRTAWKSSE